MVACNTRETVARCHKGYIWQDFISKVQNTNVFKDLVLIPYFSIVNLQIIIPTRLYS